MLLDSTQLLVSFHISLEIDLSFVEHPVQIGIDDATDLPRPPSQPILTEPIAEIQVHGL